MAGFAETTIAEFERDFDRTWDANMAALAEGMEDGLERGAQEAREDAPRQTGNMAEGIGIDETFAASDRTIPGLESLRDYKVRIGETEVTGVIGFPMEYTGHVIEAGRFDPGPALKRTPGFIAAGAEERLDRVR